MANRWVFLTFAADPNANWYSCLAVSASGDPLGTYYRYQFPAAGEPDYQKLAVWPDAYYGTANIIIGTNGALSPTACAYERAAMLNGQPARQICFATSSASGISLLPSDLDGATLPPTGSANYLLNLDPSLNGPLGFWKFHVDWSNPANSSLIMQPAVTGAPFSVFSCLDMSGVPQSSMSKLDVLGDRLLYRLAYRNFGDHESLLATHNVCGSGSNVGERWYELRNPGTGISVYQQGTYSPTDGNDRWMGSGVMDQAGDVAVGFSIGSLSKPVSVHYATHLSSDPLGVMTAENSIVDSTQFAPWSGVVGENLRWGDYTSMRIDPSDDCTMWYSNEYFLPGNSINPTTWSTRIGSFRLSNCGAVTSPPPPPCTHAHKGCRQ
jgi:hypothetical protein